jgi:hydrogenase nickel incorporation protein HypB
MCASCGCQGHVTKGEANQDEGNQNEAMTTVLNLQTGTMTPIAAAGERDNDADGFHEHVHADGTRHSHAHDHSVPHRHDGDYAEEASHHHARLHRHGDAHGHDDPVTHVVDIETRILAKNDALAAKNRAWFAGCEILALNLVSSPGSGKTMLLERTIAGLASELPLFVIEGDQATANDGERIRAAGAPVVQVNTGTGCHLDAEMVARGLSELKPGPGAVVFIENVGNLVCPALFDLGERAKTVIFSTTEGEDKPLKYPHMFRAAALVILNKIDLLPHLDFSVPRAVANVRQVNPEVTMLEVSARTGEGLADWYAWIRGQVVAAKSRSATKSWRPSLGSATISLLSER